MKIILRQKKKHSFYYKNLASSLTSEFCDKMNRLGLPKIEDETLPLITAQVNKHGCRMYCAMLVKSWLKILKFLRESDVTVYRIYEMYKLFKDALSSSEPALESISSK